ncbi:RNA polymerase sigma factor sigI [Clostridium putrefaciens]|uniref:RNA polymerase sigma factor sigI n=1 Tax=Clostridium putrefaciens TaxID=99675 RepID=A0A381JAF5_9CLOT|nr:hypothetical protein [Clostridium putrefaciens]SUY47969.1 RNA polymerase sigma factor sigI [Clostridium putrefaciens]
MDCKFMLVENKYKFVYTQKIIMLEDNFVNKIKDDIYLFIKELSLYGIVLKDLCKSCPPYDVKNQLLNISFSLVENPNITNLIKKDRSLPIKRLSILTDKSPRFISKWENYLIAYYLIISNPQYNNIKNYLNIQATNIDLIESISNKSKLNSDSNEDNVISTALTLYDESQSNNLCTGILLISHRNRGIILNSYGEFIRIKLLDEPSSQIGLIVSGIKSKSLKLYRYSLSISIFVLIILSLIYLLLQNQISTTIILEANASLNISVNMMHKVTKVTPKDTNGKEISSSLNLTGKSINQSLELILNKGKELNFIEERSTIYIYINGNKLNKNDLSSCESFVKQNRIDARINNSGENHNINPQ